MSCGAHDRCLLELRAFCDLHLCQSNWFSLSQCEICRSCQELQPWTRSKSDAWFSEKTILRACAPELAFCISAMSCCVCLVRLFIASSLWENNWKLYWLSPCWSETALFWTKFRAIGVCFRRVFPILIYWVNAFYMSLALAAVARPQCCSRIAEWIDKHLLPYRCY